MESIVIIALLLRTQSLSIIDDLPVYVIGVYRWRGLGVVLRQFVGRGSVIRGS